MIPENEKKYLEMGKNKSTPLDMKYPGWLLNCDHRCCESFRRDNKIDGKVALEGARINKND